MQRFPNGIDEEGFLQKEASNYFPKWVTTVDVPLIKGGTLRMVVADSAATLVYLANQAVLTFHVWLSTVAHLDKPDRMVFDLDPSDNDFSKVIKTAHLRREILENNGYKPQAMTTGSRGLHVLVPIKPTRDFDDVRNEAKHITKAVIERNEALTTMETSKSKRGNKVYIDIFRNAYGASHVVPYSLRAKPGAPIATPID